AAAAAARKKALRDQEEEEKMTQYEPKDLQDDWEFKIVHSPAAAFRRPETLRKLIDEEAQSGWVFLEKLDDSRVRFKRSVGARYRDALLPEGVDPYRTRYGRGSKAPGAVLAIMMGLLLAGVLAFMVFNGSQGESGSPIVWSSVSVLVGIVAIALGMLMVLLKRRR
ncbi:MAG TPA: hypothetical protein VM537_33240, partial [Anaerolineae bacterium]|nr:hypothetical protein [Anaerolineae bacterium]